VTSFPQQITYRPLILRVNVTFGEDVESKHFGKPKGIVLVINMLHPFVLLDGGRIRQMYGESFRHQSVNEPVPVVGRLDHDTLKSTAEQLKSLGDGGNVVGQFLVEDAFSTTIDNCQIAVG
jgi:hypothetical protein